MQLGTTDEELDFLRSLVEAETEEADGDHSEDLLRQILLAKQEPTEDNMSYNLGGSFLNIVEYTPNPFSEELAVGNCKIKPTRLLRAPCHQWPRRQPNDMIIWEFPKIRGTLFYGPYNKDPTI